MHAVAQLIGLTYMQMLYLFQSALKLHHTKFGDRRINIELSCGGGGKTEERTEKMKSKNKRVQRQRLKRRKKKTESQDVTDD